MKKIILILVLFLSVLPSIISAQNVVPRYEAEVEQIISGSVTLRILEGPYKDQKMESQFYDPKQNFKEGEQVIVSIAQNPNTGDLGIMIEDRVRRFPLQVLFAIFILVVITVGRLKGVLSFVGMIFSFVIIGKFIVPQIIFGNDPLLISLFGALFIIPVTFYIGHGLKWQTTISVLSTFIALFITGVLAYIFVTFTKLTGFSAEEAVFIQALPGQQINIQSLLLAGIIIGAMGVLDDITIAQTSIVDKLMKANPKYTFKQVFSEAMDVGRDHISSLVNTLILVYAGASLPLFVLFYNAQLGSYSDVMNMEVIATEIVRTLVSSIGIISAVPITTLLASWYIKKQHS